MFDIMVYTDINIVFGYQYDKTQSYKCKKILS